MNIDTDKGVWRKLLESTKKWTREVTSVEMDVKNQYSFLPKKECWMAFMDAVEICKRRKKEGIMITRKVEWRKEDGWGIGEKKKYINLSWEDILGYVKYELDNSWFKVGDKVLYQKHGIPMGAMISPALAVIYCMWRENICKRVWNVDAVLFAGRFRDDIRVVIKKRSGVSAEEVRRSVNGIYGHGLTVELEEVSENKGKFIDIAWTWINGTVTIVDNNKNFINDKLTKTKVRYPEAVTNWNLDVILNTMIGVLKRSYAKCNNWKGWLESCMMHIIEWLDKGYKSKWILNVFAKIDVVNLMLYKELIVGMEGA